MNTPPIIDRARPRPWLAALLVGSAAGMLFLFFRFNPAQNGFYPRCMFHSVTGLWCPGCGGLRAVHHLAHGHLLTALRFNPLFVLSLPLLAWYGARPVARWLAGGPPPNFALKPAAWYWVGVVVVLFGILRNLPFVPFTWLAPP